MWSSYLLTLYRSLTRHRLYAALNIGGLALGVAVFLVLLLTVRFEMSYDRWIPDAANIHRLNVTWTIPGRDPTRHPDTQGIALPALQAAYPQITAATRVKADGVVVRQGDQTTRETLMSVDPGFFDVFDLPLVAGDAATALNDPSSLILSESTARKYFGDQPALGRTLSLTFNAPREYRVTGVLKDLPANSTLDIEMIALIDLTAYSADQAELLFERWGSSTLSTYFRFASAEDAQAVNRDLGPFVTRLGTVSDLQGQPLADVMGYDLTAMPDLRFADARMRSGGAGIDPMVVATLAIVGVATLLIAAVNYINLSTARAGLRTREVALRKVLGGTRRSLMLQFLAESMALAGLASLIGLALAELALPAVNAMAGTDLDIPYFGADGALLMLAVVTLVVGLGAGLYPAFVLSRPDAAAALAASKTSGGGRAGQRVREVLVVIQFAIGIAFAASTAVMWSQAQFLRNADLGFDRDGLIVVDSLSDSTVSERRDTLVEAFRRQPGVVAIALSDRAPNSDNVTNVNVSLPGHRGAESAITVERVGVDYFGTLDIDLVAGRLFDPANGLDDVAQGSEGRNVMLSVAGAALLDFDTPTDAVGKTIRVAGGDVTVIGVAEDVRYRSPRETVPPLLYFYDSGAFDNPIAMVRYSGIEAADVGAGLRTAWRTIAPDVPFEYQTANDTLAEFYQPDERRGRLFGTGALLAVAIGCLGLYGLAAFTAARRTREIGIRKALGASTGDVLRLLALQFLRPVILANLIAWPLAWWLMRGWLAGFDQRIALSPLYFLAASLLALLVAALTIAFQAVRAARRAPADALRYE